MEQLILHLIGDYVTQSDWMANNKTKTYYAALAHAFVYSLPFLLLHPSPCAIWTILWTHFLIDRYRVARFVCYAKNTLFDPITWKAQAGHMARWSDEDYLRWQETRWENCSTTGYPSQRPPWLAVWLLIAADNTMHLTINYCALRWL